MNRLMVRGTIVVALVFLGILPPSGYAMEKSADSSPELINLSDLTTWQHDYEINQGFEHYLGLTVNEVDTGKMALILISQGQFHIESQVLRELGLNVPEELQGLIRLDEQEGVQIQYDVRNQHLFIWLPPSWFSDQYVSLNRRTYFRAMASPGAIMNYDAYYANQKNGTSRLNVYHDARVFNQHATFFTSGAYFQDFSTREHSKRTSGYRRYETNWRYIDQDRLLSLIVGDVISRPLGWTSPVRLGGGQLSRDFSMRPDIITYPIPLFMGTAIVPTTVDVFIDGVRTSRELVDPGQYTIANIPAISGAGQATVVTTDIQGRRTELSQPFYIASQLLRSGLHSYSISAGALRQDFGVRDFSYQTNAVTASYRYGFNNHVTGEFHAEFTGDLRHVGAGSAFAIGHRGVVELSARVSDYQDLEGHEFTMGYGYRSRKFTFAARHTKSSEGFMDLSKVAAQNRLAEGSSSSQVNVSIPFGAVGSLSGGYFENKRDDSKARIANVTYARTLFRRASMFFSYNNVLNNGWFAAINVTMPVGRRNGVLNTGYRYINDASNSAYMQYSHSAPLSGGVGFSAGYQHREQSNDYRSANMTWRGQQTQLRTGFYGTGSDDVYWAEASGSVVFMDGHSFASNRVRDGFVLVSAGGYADVPVRYENQVVARTNEKGYALIPNATRYYAGRYTLDSLFLPPDVSLNVSDIRVAVKPNSGYLLRFEPKQEYAAHIQLVDAQGHALPMGATYVMNADSSGVVGYDGLIYLRNLARDNQIKVTGKDGERCVAELKVNDETGSLLSITTIICR